MNTNYDELRSLLKFNIHKRIAAETRCAVIDFASALREETGYLEKDGLHITPRTQEKLAGLILGALCRT